MDESSGDGGGVGPDPGPFGDVDGLVTCSSPGRCTVTAELFVGLVKAVRLLGARCALTGISPAMAAQLVEKVFDLLSMALVALAALALLPLSRFATAPLTLSLRLSLYGMAGLGALVLLGPS